MQISHFEEYIVFVCEHSKPIEGSQADDEKPLAAALQNQMAFQAGDGASVVAADIGTEQWEKCQLFQVLTSQVDLVVAQGHSIHTAKFRQCQSTSAPVGLHHKAFQVQKVPAVQIEVRFCPVFLKIGADPAQKSKIGVDVVGVVDVQTHKSLLTFDSANGWCAAT